MGCIILVLITVLFPVTANAKQNVVFLGISGENAPSLQNGFEIQLHEKLTMDPEIEMADYLECQKLKRFTKFDDSPAISESALNSLLKFINDSTLIIWGEIRGYQIKPERIKLLFKEIKGELTVTLHIYSIASKSYLYINDINTIERTMKKISLFNFSNPLSAVDRAEITEKLKNSTVNDCIRIVSSIVKNQKQDSDTPIVSTDSQNRDPAITDLFLIPSTEAASINSTETSQSPVEPKDSTGGGSNLLK